MAERSPVPSFQSGRDGNTVECMAYTVFLGRSINEQGKPDHSPQVRKQSWDHKLVEAGKAYGGIV